MTVFFLSLPLLLVVGKVLITQWSFALLLLIPFLLPSMVTGLILWLGMIEKLTQRRLENFESQVAQTPR